MLNKLNICSYKSIKKQSFDLKPLTILTGTNSSGKSSVIQALLLVLSANTIKYKPYLDKVIAPYLDYQDVFCRWSDKNQVTIELFSDNNKEHFDFYIKQGNSNGFPVAILIDTENYQYEENFFYLASNRLGPEEVSLSDKNLQVGEQGQYILGSFEKLKNQPIAKELQHESANTPNLKAQLAYWFSKILDQAVELESEKILANSVKNTFVFEDIGTVTPSNVGAGNSYLVKLLILGLIAKPGYLLLIENPEIHLHPKAQSKLATFFAFIASRGVQVILETHSEHFINRVRYEIYSKKITAADVKIYYKPKAMEDFLVLDVSDDGHYLNTAGEKCGFPEGFFDASLREIFEINSGG